MIIRPGPIANCHCAFGGELSGLGRPDSEIAVTALSRKHAEWQRQHNLPVAANFPRA